MNLVHNIVVVSDDDPSKLRTQLKPIKLDKHVGLAVTSFSHGEIYNVHSGNNKVHIKLNTHSNLEQSKKFHNYLEIVQLEIPKGRYQTSLLLLKEIERVIKKHYGTGSLFEVKQFKPAPGKIVVSMLHMKIFVTKKTDTPWSLLDIDMDLDKPRVEIENRDLLKGIETAFLYVNIVENSYINGKLSRNLTILPLDVGSSKGLFYEFKHPNYVPIEIKEFSNILLEIRNMQGEYVPFRDKSRTVISLHLKPINRDH